MSSCARSVSGWQLDRYNGTFANGSRVGFANRLGTVLGTVGSPKLGNSRKSPKCPSKFHAVRWPRG